MASVSPSYKFRTCFFRTIISCVFISDTVLFSSLSRTPFDCVAQNVSSSSPRQVSFFFSLSHYLPYSLSTLLNCSQVPRSKQVEVNSLKFPIDLTKWNRSKLRYDILILYFIELCVFLCCRRWHVVTVIKLYRRSKSKTINKKLGNFLKISQMLSVLYCVGENVKKESINLWMCWKECV